MHVIAHDIMGPSGATRGLRGDLGRDHRPASPYVCAHRFMGTWPLCAQPLMATTTGHHGANVDYCMKSRRKSLDKSARRMRCRDVAA